MNDDEACSPDACGTTPYLCASGYLSASMGDSLDYLECLEQWLGSQHPDDSAVVNALVGKQLRVGI